VIYLLALPWARIDWPDFLLARDVVWLIVLPLFLNLASIGIFTSGLFVRRGPTNTDDEGRPGHAPLN